MERGGHRPRADADRRPLVGLVPRARASPRRFRCCRTYCFAQALVRAGFLWEEPHTAEDLTARPLWHILSEQGLAVGVIGWPLTHPAAPVHGYQVSDRFHRMTGAELDIDGTSAIWPPSALPVARSSLQVPPNPDPVAVVSADRASAVGRLRRRERSRAGHRGSRSRRAARGAFAAFDTRLVAVRFPGVDAVGHYFLRYANPAPFGDVSETERRQLRARARAGTTASSTRTSAG